MFSIHFKTDRDSDVSTLKLPRSVVLREITADNLTNAIEVAKSIFYYEVHSGNFWPEQAYQESIQEKNPRFKYYLATRHNEVVGITGIYEDDKNKDRVWLGWFGILPAFRNQGLGRELLTMTIEHAKSLGAKEFSLYTSDRPEEAAAIVLYEKQGFTCYHTDNTDEFLLLYYQKVL